MNKDILAIMPTIGRPTTRPVIENLLKQGAKIRVFLNGFEEIPSDWPKIDVEYRLHEKRRGPIVRYSEKVEDQKVICFVDDDITYPSNYLDVSVKNLEIVGEGCTIAWHASIWQKDSAPISRNRKCIRADSGLSKGLKISYVGSGALTMWSFDFNNLPKIESDLFEFEDDIWISSRMAQYDIKAFRPPSRRSWIRAVGGIKDTLWNRARANRFKIRNQAIQESLKDCPKWDLSSAEPSLEIPFICGA